MSEIEENFAYLRDVLGVKYLPVVTTIVSTRLMFVQEELTATPFEGAPGELLSKMIDAMGVARDEIFVGAISQIEGINPEMIVVLGETATKKILQTELPFSQLRSTVHNLNGRKLIATYHPSDLLKNPAYKKAAWSDLQIVMKELDTIKV